MRELPTSADVVTQFRANGYSRLEGVTTPADLRRITNLLDPLFARFDTLDRRAAFDLAGNSAPGARRSPEINRPSRFAPELRKTLVFQNCRMIASALLDAPAWYVFDHAIYKAPRNAAPTEWHQDEAYSGRPHALRTVNFWIPLHDVDEFNGCMWFVPGSHRSGLMPHRPVRSRPGGSVLTVVGDVTGAVACPLRAGEATVHHPLALHYTGPNHSDSSRRAWVIHFGAYGRLGALHPQNITAKMMSRLRVYMPGPKREHTAIT